MSQKSVLSSLRFFRSRRKKQGCTEEKTAEDWAETRCSQREWENLYRRRSQYDKKMIKKSGPPTESTVRVPVPGMSLSKTASWYGKPRPRTIQPPGKVFPTMSRAAAQGGPPIHGILTVPSASNIPWSDPACWTCGDRPWQPPLIRWRPGKALPKTKKNGAGFIGHGVKGGSSAWTGMRPPP